MMLMEPRVWLVYSSVYNSFTTETTRFYAVKFSSNLAQSCLSVFTWTESLEPILNRFDFSNLSRRLQQSIVIASQ